MRSKLQESEQARRSGTKLGSPGSEADWMAAVRLGRKRRAVGAETLSEITVSLPLTAFVRGVLHSCHLA